MAETLTLTDKTPLDGTEQEITNSAYRTDFDTFANRTLFMREASLSFKRQAKE